MVTSKDSVTGIQGTGNFSGCTTEAFSIMTELLVPSLCEKQNLPECGLQELGAIPFRLHYQKKKIIEMSQLRIFPRISVAPLFWHSGRLK